MVEPLRRAAEKGDVALARHVISSLGSKHLDAQGLHGRTALHEAVYWGNKEVARFLIRSGANLDAKDHAGQTPIIYAAKGGQEDMIELLASRGADVDAGDSSGMTGLMHAAHLGETEVAETLLRRGASITVKDNMGRSALDIATDEAREEVLALLKDTAEQQAAREARDSLIRGLSSAASADGCEDGLCDVGSESLIARRGLSAQLDHCISSGGVSSLAGCRGGLIAPSASLSGLGNNHSGGQLLGGGPGHCAVPWCHGTGCWGTMTALCVAMLAAVMWSMVGRRKLSGRSGLDESLSARESDVGRRESLLAEREAQLTQREAAVARREADLAARERKRAQQ